jgi:flagellar biosynthetic protein FlhB
VAKGADAVAFRIRELAKANTTCPSSRTRRWPALSIASVDIDQTIPTEHFKAVAEVIGFVMRLKQRRQLEGGVGQYAATHGAQCLRVKPEGTLGAWKLWT